MSLALRYTYFEKSYDIEKERKVRDVTRKKIDEIDRLETELKEKEELKYIEDCKNSELLSDLGHDKEDILGDHGNRSRLIKLRIPPIQIDRIKDSILSS